MKNNAFEIQITPHPQKADWYVAKYGAVALYHFVEELRYRHTVLPRTVEPRAEPSRPE